MRPPFLEVCEQRLNGPSFWLRLCQGTLSRDLPTVWWPMTHREQPSSKRHSLIKSNQHPWIFIGKTDAEAETSIIWPPDLKSWLTGKDPDAGKPWGQEEKGVTEDEIFGWHHQLNRRESEQTPGDSEGQESLACCSPWGLKESDATYWLNNNI